MEGQRDLDALCLWPAKAGPFGRSDTITPHKITVVFLVQEFHAMKMQDSDTAIAPRYRRQFAMLLLKLIQFPDLNYCELFAMLQHPHYELHPTHLATFQHLVENISAHGIQVLFELPRFIEKLITETTTVNHYGILGHYVRRIMLVLDKLSFGEMMELFEQMKLYYTAGIRVIERDAQARMFLRGRMTTPLPADGYLDFKHTGTKMPTAPTMPPPSWSVKQADLFVAQQCNLLENNEPLALTPYELQTKLDEIIADNPLYAQAHILGYMNMLRIRDMLGAQHAFHRAFDRSAVRANTPPETKGFQYSSLNLAIMHAQFDHRVEALVSLRECVMLAQECGDRVCLQLAQAWLCLLDRDYVQLCERSVASQTELSLVHSVSLGVQYIVNVAAVSGFQPAKLFELLMKSEVINFQHSLMDLMANCIAQKAAVWTLYGKNEVASLCSQLLLHVVRTQNSRESDSMENGEGVCHSLCCTAMWLSLRGDYNLSGALMQHARNRFPRDPLARVWMTCDAHITAVQAMHRGRWDDAVLACSQLYTLDRTVGLLMRATLLLRRGNAAAAERIVRERLLADEGLEPLFRVRASMLLAHCRSADMAAVNVLNECSVYARSMYLSYEVALIDVHAAHLLLALQQPKQAFRTIRRCMNTILSDGGIYDTARMLFVFVRCAVGAECQTDAAAVAHQLDKCDEFVRDAVEKFRKIEATAKVKDMFVWLAQTNHSCGRIEERNRWARKLQELDRFAPTPVEHANVFY